MDYTNEIIEELRREFEARNVLATVNECVTDKITESSSLE